MTAANFGNCLAIVLSYEGGFVDDLRDPGGATNWGVTLDTLSAFRGKPCTVEDVKGLTRAAVAPIYARDYWAPISGDALPAGLDLICFDTAVNQGPGTAARILQQAAGVSADGAIGPATLKAVATTPAAVLIERVRQARLARYRADEGWAAFGQGWSRRVDGVAAIAAVWATKGAGVAAPAIEAARSDNTASVDITL